MSDVLAVRDGYRAQMWIEIIRECKASGMSNKDFCLQLSWTKKASSYFRGRRTVRIKVLYWCGEGYLLLYKRLSNGRFQWPEVELRLLDPQSFRWLMEGLRKMRRKDETHWQEVSSP